VIRGGKIRELRKERGWSQADLARSSGISQPTIAAIERGTQRTARNIQNVAKALGVSISELDPEFETFDLASAATAFEVILERIRSDLTPESRRALKELFLDLAQQPKEENDLPLDRMRLLARLPLQSILNER
jgi:transcriptional regulator with XRE-family HTH domain